MKTELPELIKQAASLVKQLNELRLKHLSFYKAAEYYYLLVDERPEETDNIHLSIYSRFLSNSDIEVLDKAKELEQALEAIDDEIEEEEES